MFGDNFNAPYDIGDSTLAAEAHGLVVRKLASKQPLLQVKLRERSEAELVLWTFGAKAHGRAQARIEAAIKEQTNKKNINTYMYCLPPGRRRTAWSCASSPPSSRCCRWGCTKHQSNFCQPNTDGSARAVLHAEQLLLQASFSQLIPGRPVCVTLANVICGQLMIAQRPTALAVRPTTRSTIRCAQFFAD